MEGSPHRTPKMYTSPATPPAQPILATSPTSSPFRNIKPKTRQERAALRDKVALEKDRLMKRTGLAAKMYRENAPDTSDGLVVPRPDAAGFMADSDRFHTDVVGEDKLRRDAKIKQDYLRRDHTRLERAKAEEQRATAERAPRGPVDPQGRESAAVGARPRAARPPAGRAAPPPV